MKNIIMIIVLIMGMCTFLAKSVMAEPPDITADSITATTVTATYSGSEDYGAAVKGLSDSGGGFTTGVFGESTSPRGVGVTGFASAVSGETVGVWGESTSPLGIGVFGLVGADYDDAIGVLGQSNSRDGIAVRGDGINHGVYGFGYHGYGVYGSSVDSYGVYGYSERSYAIYSNGNTHIRGNLTVTGSIPEYTNLARDASAMASTEFNDNYAASKINDGIICIWDVGEWATLGERAGAWIQLDWSSPGVTFNKVMIYPRPNRFDRIYDAWLQIKRSDNSTTDLHLGQSSNGGVPTEIHLNRLEGTNVTALKVLITETSPDTQNIGLAEIECYYNPNLWSE